MLHLRQVRGPGSGLLEVEVQTTRFFMAFLEAYLSDTNMSPSSIPYSWFSTALVDISNRG